MSKISNVTKPLTALCKNFFEHWNTPSKGRFVPNKEAVCYCVGGMGAVGASVIPSFITLSAGLYISAALRIKMDDIILVGIITSVITLLKSPFVSMLLDNTNSKKGKFHPYLMWMPIPIVVSTFALGWIPYLLMEKSYLGMVVAYTVIFNILQFFMGLYSTAFTMLVQVISPSPEERTGLMSIGAFVYSLGPSIVNAGFPLVANLLFTKEAVNAQGETIKILGVNDIGSAQWVAPVFMAIFCGLGYLAAFFVKERAVISKQYKQKVSFLAGIKKTIKNKYFWIINISSVLVIFKMIGTTFVAWICTYMYKNAYAQSIFITIMGSANVPGMLLAPMLIKKIGNRNLVIITNLLVGVLTVPMLFFMNAPLPLLIIPLLITAANGVQVVTVPAMNSQLYDYQQYRTGDRLEGFLSQFGGIIVTIGTMLTALVQPAICKHFGFIDNSDVLYNPDVIQPIIRTMLIIAIVSSVLGTIPMLFWDLTEKRHRQIMDVLRVRADLEDGLCDEETSQQLEARIEAGEENVLADRAAVLTEEQV